MGVPGRREKLAKLDELPEWANQPAVPRACGGAHFGGASPRPAVRSERNTTGVEAGSVFEMTRARMPGTTGSPRA